MTMPTVDAWTWLSQHLPLEAVSTLRPTGETTAAMLEAAGQEQQHPESWDAWLTVGFGASCRASWLALLQARPVK